jgi:hypothetical protein
MIYVRLTGRLGNQMFQYATARALAETRATAVGVDVSAYLYPSDWKYFQLWRFPRLRLHSLVPQYFKNKTQDVFKFQSRRRRPYAMSGLGFDPGVLQLPDWTALRGFFTSERYFSSSENLIKTLFCLKEFLSIEDVSDLQSKFPDRTPVSVHVRRGDYMGNDLFDIGDLDPYYKQCFTQALSEMPDAYFVVFSDDPEWCLQWTLLRAFDAHVIKAARPRCMFQDMALMTWCRHHVIVNSTFGWWGAWLGSNPRKRVFMPAQWLNRWTSKECGLSVPGWTEIEPRG